MRLTLWIAALAAIFAGWSTSSLHNITGPLLPLSDSSQHVKRWYGVPEGEGANIQGGWGPWPVMCKEPEPVQAIRYCFKDKRSADNLQPIVDQTSADWLIRNLKAVARWAHALHPFTTLTISLDNRDEKVCNDQVRKDALVVTDTTRDGDEAFNWEKADTLTTTGYDYRSKDPWRHSLKFGHLVPGAGERNRETAIVNMMHELGHAMGLAHEHQRPDAWQHLHYKCENLQGYTEAVRSARDDDNALFDFDEADDDPNEEQIELRMKLVCTEAIYARDTLKSALSFIPGSNMYQNTRADDRWKDYVMSTKFDAVSIMNYNSWTGSSKPEAEGKEGWVIWQKDRDKALFMGGAEDAKAAKISEGDVARVAQMYPLPEGGSEDLQKIGVWGKQAVRVKIRGDLDMVVEPPRQTD
ncbi:hypothetical protein D0867_01469 [Hortaea werneckii]|uniref:Peptidase M12A domain-containing protein n=1 Tax=Hortaea werneckii TaxID=91943 RepID=A0A3M7AA42_HORWE|nr:hypothetical protein D0867_01469 [Hortaea werneckii]